MGIENSLKSELEEILEDPTQLCPPTINTDEQITKIKKTYRRKIKREHSETDGESTINDSAFSDTESLSRYVDLLLNDILLGVVLKHALTCVTCLVVHLVLIAIDVHL